MILRVPSNRNRSTMAAGSQLPEQTSRTCCQEHWDGHESRPISDPLPPLCPSPLPAAGASDARAKEPWRPERSVCPVPGGGWAPVTPSNPLTQIASGSSPPHSPPGSCAGSNFSASASASAQLLVPLALSLPLSTGPGQLPPPCSPSTGGSAANGTPTPPPFAGFFIAGRELRTQP
nr:uncharacterized protein PB18E9.04c-like [Columba livia]